MPKNKGKGGKSKRKGKNKSDEGDKRELVLREAGQEYAQVVRVLGNCRVEAYCFDGTTRLAHVRGKFRKKVWINKDDIILVGLRDYEDGKADVIHKYSSDEARQLKALKQLPERVNVDGGDAAASDDDNYVDFDSDAEGGGASSEEEESEEESSDEDIDVDDL
jgi:translation initiation factor 1A